MAARFRRPKGDVATARATVHIRGVAKCLTPSAEQLKDLDHGDLVYCRNCNRGTDTWVVVVDDDGVRKLKATGKYSWCTKIDAAVTRHIEDPLDFYRAVVVRNTYRSITVIGLDMDAHDGTIKAASGGRSVDQPNFVWWASYNNYGDLELSAARDYPCGWSIPLDENTPDIRLAVAQ